MEKVTARQKAIRKQIAQRNKEELKRTLEQGYKANCKESLVAAKEFEAAELEGWDEF